MDLLKPAPSQERAVIRINLWLVLGRWALSSWNIIPDNEGFFMPNNLVLQFDQMGCANSVIYGRHLICFGDGVLSLNSGGQCHRYGEPT